MSQPRLLIVEDDPDIAELLKLYFSSQGYEVDVAPRGTVALEKTRQQMPHLIVLDIMLPDIDGYEVCEQLRTNVRTAHIPIIFLTQKDERSDRLRGLELGADDYITKPFDIEELRLRVQNAIMRAERERLTDPRSGLPGGRLIEDHLRRIIRESGWAMMDIRILHYDAFRDVYGFVAASDVLRFMAMLLSEVVDELGTSNDFLGHPSEENFIVITSEEAAPAVRARLKERFDKEILTHYNFIDRERGYLVLPDESGEETQVPLMSLAIGVVFSSQFEFADIREITELAAEARRRDMGEE
ncbi:MAG TPA: response regulator [Anaerolineae bacterium]|nr:response regulator [Anaerolineae bacterium]HID84976.1 response regulator [Anaerolineales bacterium]HIQ09412.1 response regulator [Anaerolineaceae bacterium]